MMYAYLYYSEYMQGDHMEDLGLNNNKNFCLDKQQISQGGSCSLHRLKKIELASIKNLSLEAAINFQAEGLKFEYPSEALLSSILGCTVFQYALLLTGVSAKFYGCNRHNCATCSHYLGPPGHNLSARESIFKVMLCLIY